MDRYFITQEFRHLDVGHQKVKVPGKEIPGDDVFAQLACCNSCYYHIVSTITQVFSGTEQFSQ